MGGGTGRSRYSRRRIFVYCIVRYLHIRSLQGLQCVCCILRHLPATPPEAPSGRILRKSMSCYSASSLFLPRCALHHTTAPRHRVRLCAVRQDDEKENPPSQFPIPLQKTSHFAFISAPSHRCFCTASHRTISYSVHNRFRPSPSYPYTLLVLAVAHCCPLVRVREIGPDSGPHHCCWVYYVQSITGVLALGLLPSASIVWSLGIATQHGGVPTTRTAT